MTREILARCGFRCDLCLAYNIESNNQRQLLSDGWFKIYGFKIPPKKIYCDGCINDECLTPKLIDKDCPVRSCVIEKGIENCSQCDEYICDKLKDRIVVYEDLLKKDNMKISRKEYIRFVKPYENKKRLDELRKENYPNSRMLNKEIIPTENVISLFLSENSIISVWNNITSFINNNYNFNSKIIFGGKKYGWTIAYKHGQKTIVTLLPERKSFTVLLVFGKKEVEKIFENRDLFTKRILRLIEKTKQYHDGKWVWIRIDNNAFENDICNLIKIKKKPPKK